MGSFCRVLLSVLMRGSQVLCLGSKLAAPIWQNVLTIVISKIILVPIEYYFVYDSYKSKIEIHMNCCLNDGKSEAPVLIAAYCRLHIVNVSQYASSFLLLLAVLPHIMTISFQITLIIITWPFSPLVGHTVSSNFHDILDACDSVLSSPLIN